jgi:hypothetical protein
MRGVEGSAAKGQGLALACRREGEDIGIPGFYLGGGYALLLASTVIHAASSVEYGPRPDGGRRRLGRRSHGEGHGMLPRAWIAE